MTRGRDGEVVHAFRLARVRVTCARGDVAWIRIASTDDPLTLARFLADRRRKSDGWLGPISAWLEAGDGHPEDLDLGVVLGAELPDRARAF